MGECVNPPLPIENIYSRRDAETRLAAAHGFVKIWLKWLRPVPAGELSPSLEVNPLLSHTEEIKTELSEKCNTTFGKMKNGSLDLQSSMEEYNTYTLSKVLKVQYVRTAC